MDFRKRRKRKHAKKLVTESERAEKDGDSSASTHAAKHWQRSSENFELLNQMRQKMMKDDDGDESEAEGQSEFKFGREKDDLYDENLDDIDAKYVSNTLNTQYSDCTLCCPQCFNIIAYCCKKEPNVDQFYAPNVHNVKINDEGVVFCQECDTIVGKRVANPSRADETKTSNDEKKDKSNQTSSQETKQGDNGADEELSFVWKPIGDLYSIASKANINGNSMGTTQSSGDAIPKQVNLNDSNGDGNETDNDSDSDEELDLKDIEPKTTSGDNDFNEDSPFCYCLENVFPGLA